MAALAGEGMRARRGWVRCAGPLLSCAVVALSQSQAPAGDTRYCGVDGGGSACLFPYRVEGGWRHGCVKGHCALAVDAEREVLLWGRCATCTRAPPLGQTCGDMGCGNIEAAGTCSAAAAEMLAVPVPDVRRVPSYHRDIPRGCYYTTGAGGAHVVLINDWPSNGAASDVITPICDCGAEPNATASISAAEVMEHELLRGGGAAVPQDTTTVASATNSTGTDPAAELSPPIPLWAWFLIGGVLLLCVAIVVYQRWSIWRVDRFFKRAAGRMQAPLPGAVPEPGAEEGSLNRQSERSREATLSSEATPSPCAVRSTHRGPLAAPLLADETVNSLGRSVESDGETDGNLSGLGLLPSRGGNPHTPPRGVGDVRRASCPGAVGDRPAYGRGGPQRCRVRSAAPSRAPAERALPAGLFVGTWDNVGEVIERNREAYNDPGGRPAPNEVVAKRMPQATSEVLPFETKVLKAALMESFEEVIEEKLGALLAQHAAATPVGVTPPAKRLGSVPPGHEEHDLPNRSSQRRGSEARHSLKV
eukprot:TRINITY_DN19495_c0_g1_i1.p1 TRINITY_DN19495_c0_g1~~TRINITY_DN19495_c0_g1_i1.p1  ORF type:complete len:532 (+),score=54.56 TRINITY_DN19495_c0_g1_i1:63-1658(+)